MEARLWHFLSSFRFIIVTHKHWILEQPSRTLKGIKTYRNLKTQIAIVLTNFQSRWWGDLPQDKLLEQTLTKHILEALDQIKDWKTMTMFGLEEFQLIVSKPPFTDGNIWTLKVDVLENFSGF